MKTFKAMAVSAMEMPELDCFVVVLIERPDGSGAQLEVQRALTFNEQDRELGQDTYCLCDEWGRVHYGGVVSWRISVDTLEIKLDGAASNTLGTEGYIIELEIGPEVRAELEDGLRRVLN